jgi:retinol dehydrogenase-12
MDNVLNFIKENRIAVYSATSLVVIALLKRFFNGPSAKKTNLSKKVIIVTGSSDGIGKVTAENLLKQGATVIFACRNENKTRNLISTFDKKYQENAIYMHLDLSSFKSVKEFIEEFYKKFDKLNILVNNAGAIIPEFKFTENNIESTLQMNTFAPMLLTQELLPLLNKNEGKVINVSSEGHKLSKFDAQKLKLWESLDWDYNKSSYSLLSQYCYSKLGNIYFTQYLQEYIFQKRLDVTTYSLHPGTIMTNMASDPAYFKIRLLIYLFYPLIWLVTKSVNKGAQTTLHLCYEDKKMLKSGEYYSNCKIESISQYAKWESIELRDGFIEVSRKIINKEASSVGLQFSLKVERHI